MGRIVLQTDPAVNNHSNCLLGITPPDLSPTSGETTQDATNVGLSSELRPPSHAEHPPQNVFGGAEGLITDASHSIEVNETLNPGTPIRTSPQDLLLVVFVHGYVTSSSFILISVLGVVTWNFICVCREFGC